MIMNFYFRKISLLLVPNVHTLAAISISLVILLTAIHLPGCRSNDNLSPCDGSTLEVDVYKGPANTGGFQLTWYIVPREDVSFHDPAIAPDGTIWYTDQWNSCIGRIDPERLTVTEFPTGISGANPHGITADETGNIWYAATVAGKIGRYNPDTDEYRSYTMPDEVDDVHSLTSVNGMIWFTAPRSNVFGNLNPATGEVTVFESPGPGSRPYGINASHDGKIWVAFSGTNRIASVDPADGTVNEWELPDTGSRPLMITSGRNGTVWYTDYEKSKIGSLDTSTGEFRIFNTARDNAFPRSLTVGPDERIWYYEEATNLIVGLDPGTGEYTVLETGSPDTVIRKMVTDIKRGKIWMTLGAARAIGGLEL
jgi:virginiamycin B lyase